MTLNLSDFLTPQNILFFAILGIIVFIIAVIFFLVVVLIFRFLAKIFGKIFRQKEEFKQVTIDRGEDLDITVRELEESKTKTQKMVRSATGGPAINSENYQNQIPAPEKKVDSKEDFRAEEQKDIEKGLNTLKSVSAGGLASKMPQKEGVGLIEKNQHGPAAINLGSSVSGPKEKRALDSKPDSLEKLVNKSINAKDDSVFGGKGEITRIDLRQKLRGEKAFSASRQVGLSMTAAERAKLEKEVFSQALGGNISKTDLKWAVKGLNKKYITSKNISEKGTIRKQIKFIKKIGGIK